MVQKQEGSKIVNFKMTEEDLERLDKLVEKEGYHDRADAIRTLIRMRFEIQFPVSAQSAEAQHA